MPSDTRCRSEERELLANLLVRLQRWDDEKALEEILDRTKRDVYRWAYFAARDEKLAEELRQDVFVAFLAGYNGIKDPRSLQAWLHRTLLNIFWRKRARKKREISMPPRDLDLLLAAAPDKKSPAEIALEEERESDFRQALSEHLNRLPDSLRECIKLAYFENLSNSEIARRRNVKTDTVIQNKSRALLYLSKVPALQKLYEDVSK